MWIKICGVRDSGTAREIAAAGADAIGLNFYSRSPRYVSVEVAQGISRSLPTSVQRVGLFVNHTLEDVVQTTAACGLDAIQFHGDESPDYLARFHTLRPDLKIIRAWRMGDDLTDLERYLDRCHLLECELFGCLLDAHVPGVYGGSGTTLPWERVSREYRRAEWPHLILAGGLNPDNVKAAVATAMPWGIDTASGVESSPGVKDPLRVAEFIAQARSQSPR